MKSPQGLKIDGLEFKALPSGLHKLSEDYVYDNTMAIQFTICRLFRQKNLYGIACFHSLKTASDERGARMRSVGILCRDYRALATHYDFLYGAVRALNDSPGNYKNLEVLCCLF